MSGQRTKAPGRTAKRSAAAPRTRTKDRRTDGTAAISPLVQWIDALGGQTSGLTASAIEIAARTRDSATRAMSGTPENLRLMAAAGESLRDMRQVAGMTVAEVSEALDLRDKTAWEAIESGREALSFEVLLRLASLVARNDPLPFVLKYTRAYNPRLWEILHELKIDQLPIQFERERSFINIYRRHDAARRLSDAEFERVLGFTQQAFDLAIHFVARQPDDEAAETPASKSRRARSAEVAPRTGKISKPRR